MRRQPRRPGAVPLGPPNTRSNSCPGGLQCGADGSAVRDCGGGDDGGTMFARARLGIAGSGGGPSGRSAKPFSVRALDIWIGPEASMISTSQSATSAPEPKTVRRTISIASGTASTGATRMGAGVGGLHQRRQRRRHVMLPVRGAERVEAAGERLPHLPRRREPIGRIGGHRPHHHLGHRRRQRRQAVARIVEPPRRDRLNDHRVGPVVGPTPGEALVKDDARRIDVAPAILGGAADPLGRGIAVLADEDRRHGRAGRRPRGAEVDQLRRAAGRDDHVVGAEIAVDEAQACRCRRRAHGPRAAPRRRRSSRGAWSPSGAARRVRASVCARSAA